MVRHRVKSLLHQYAFLINVFEIIFVGFPYCIFKIIGGSLLKDHTSLVIPLISKNIMVISLSDIVGLTLICLGCLDLVFNMKNFVSLLFLKRRVSFICLFSFLAYLYMRWVLHKNYEKSSIDSVGASLDVLVSLSIVSFVLGFRLYLYLPLSLSVLWNFFTICTIMWAGVNRMVQSLITLK